MIAYRPSAPLDRWIDRIWWNDRARPSLGSEHHLPSGRAQLVIALHDEPIAWSAPSGGETHTWTRGIVHGPQPSYYVAGPKPRGIVMGASIRPGAAGGVLGAGAAELTGRHVTLAELWGSSGELLRERLAAAATPGGAFAVLEDALLERLRDAPPLLHAVAYALAEVAAGSSRIARIQCDTGYSPRHFVALFRSAVGLTPKEYARITRFGATLRGLADAAARAGTLADLAAANGYADQSHLTREFRALAGITPTRYRPPGTASIHHHVKNVQDATAERA